MFLRRNDSPPNETRLPARIGFFSRKRSSWARCRIVSHALPPPVRSTPVVALFSPPRNDNLRHAAACLSAFFPATSTRCSSQADENRSIVTRAIEIAVSVVEARNSALHTELRVIYGQLLRFFSTSSQRCFAAESYVNIRGQRC